MNPASGALEALPRPAPDLCGGRGGIRTHGTFRLARCSRPAQSTSLPLFRLAAPRGIGPRSTDRQSVVLPLNDGAMVLQVRIERTWRGLRPRALTTSATAAFGGEGGGRSRKALSRLPDFQSGSLANSRRPLHSGNESGKNCRIQDKWCSPSDSNRQPPDPRSGASAKLGYGCVWCPLRDSNPDDPALEAGGSACWPKRALGPRRGIRTRH